MKLTRFTRDQISSHGMSSHIPGMSTRKFKASAALPGTTKRGPTRTHMGMSSSTAPHKHQTDLFPSTFSIGPEEMPP